MLKKLLFRSFLFFVVLFSGYWFYPLASTGPITLEYPLISDTGGVLEEVITERESKIPNIKPNNEAQFFWADSSKSKTEYSIVYLHGFSASQYEGFPTHINIAKKYGMNMFLSRLANHGIEGIECMNDLTADKLADSAMEAIAIGKQMGEKVIIMGCSTGGTLGLMAMAHDPEIEGAIFYSPNIELFDPNASLIRKPFGMELAEWMTGRDYHEIGNVEKLGAYWTKRYRLKGIQILIELMEKTMTEETFQKIKKPVLALAYYENEEQQDKIVSVPAMQEMISQLGTPVDKKVFKKLPTVKAHVMTCELQSSDLEIVATETSDFIENILGIKPVQ